MNKYYQAVYDHSFKDGKNLVRTSEDSEFQLVFLKLMTSATKHSSESDFVDFCRYVTETTETELLSIIEFSDKYGRAE